MKASGNCIEEVGGINFGKVEIITWVGGFPSLCRAQKCGFSDDGAIFPGDGAHVSCAGGNPGSPDVEPVGIPLIFN